MTQTPSILAAGRHDAQYLEESIREPSKKITGGYGDHLVWLSSGKTYSARPLRDGADSIDLRVHDNTGQQVVTIAKSDIELDDDDQPMIQCVQASPMPKTSLSESEIQNIVAFLETLD